MACLWLLTGSWLLALSMGSAPALAQKLYKYKNNQGTTVIASSIPSEYIQNGYSILDPYGSLVKQIPPRLTNEQQEQLQALEQIQAEQEQQARQDQELLDLYGTPDEIYAAMDRKLKQLDQKIQEMKNLEAIVKKSLDEKQKQLLKAGEKAPEYLQDDVNNLAGQRKDYRNRRVQYVQEKVALKQRYTASAERLKELIRLKNPDSSPISSEMLVGKWRIRKDIAIDWNLSASGAFDSFFQQLGSHASSKSYGHWVLSGNRIILSINQKLEKDTVGQQTRKRVSEEKRIRVLKATETELQILFDGKTVSLHRS